VPEALPHRVATSDHVRPGAWMLVVDGAPRPMPPWLVDWEYATSVIARRQIELDGEGIRREVGLPASTRVVAAITWRVADSLLNGAVRAETTTTLADGVSVIDLEVRLPGWDLGPALQLETVLLLADQHPDPGAPLAWRRASVLWKDGHKLRLMGDESQFPMAITNFAAQGLLDGAPWQLRVGQDLEAPAMGQIQLLVNERFPAVTAAVRDPASTPSGPAIRSALKVDIGRSMVERALSDDELLERNDWPEGSLGEVLETVVRSRLGEPPAQLKELRDRDPVAWSGRVASAFALFAEVDA
jgi:hypothetical protein